MSAAPGIAWGLVVPIASVALGALLVLALDAGLARATPQSRAGRRRDLVLTAVCTLALVVAVVTAAAGIGPGPAEEGAVRPHALGAISIVVVGLSGLLVTWLSSTYLMAMRMSAGAYLVLLLLGLAGAFVALAADHLLGLYVGLELLALPAHALAGWDRQRLRSNEAGVKSFLLGMLGSAVLLYGLALLYGATGHLDYAGVRTALQAQAVEGVAGGGLAVAGLAFALVGLAVKAGLAPFHQWVPDVDEGAPASATAFVAVCVRGAVLLVLVRLVVDVLPPDVLPIRTLFAVLGVIGIGVGGLMAMVQRNVKRLIAWAGIGHGGTMVLAFAAGGPDALGAVVFYAIALAVATLGVLGVVLSLASGGREVERLEDFAGVARTRPGLAALMTLFLMGLAGLPVTAGFWAKLLLLQALVDAGHVGLAAAALAGAVVSLYAYMRIPTMLYMREAPDLETGEPSTSELAVLGVCAVATLYLGVMPDPVWPGLPDGLLALLRSATLSPSGPS